MAASQSNLKLAIKNIRLWTKVFSSKRTGARSNVTLRVAPLIRGAQLGELRYIPLLPVCIDRILGIPIKFSQLLSMKEKIHIHFLDFIHQNNGELEYISM